MPNATLSFLGICRKAGRLAIGHDAAVDALVRHRAKLVLLASDGSPRLAQEAQRLCERHGVPLLRTPYTMREYEAAIGKPAAIYAVTDDGFAEKLQQKFGEELHGNET